MPTFRKATASRSYLNEQAVDSDTGIQLIHYENEAYEIDRLLEEKDISVLMKLHPIQASGQIKLPTLKRLKCVEHRELIRVGLEINKILGDADALISDYSSAAVDYLVLDRPIAFSVEDIDGFKERRGFMFANIEESLPGKLLYTFDELKQFILEIAEGVDSSLEKRRVVGTRLNEFSDDRSSERVIKALGIER